MRIEIDTSAANDPDAHYWLDRILNKIEDGWHVWDTANDPDPKEVESTAWIRDHGRAGARVLANHVASVQRGAWTVAPHGRRIRVTTQPVTAGELSPEDAARLAETPLRILVENRESDGAFVKRIVAELDKTLHKLWSRLGQPMEFDSVGGKGQMRLEVERRFQGSKHRPRLVAVIDSDRKGPADSASDQAHKLRRICEKRGVPCWVLAKREAENYLPRMLFGERQGAGASHARSVDAWDRLNDDQKDFFDMKNGLSSSPSAAEKQLFDGLSPKDRSILASGFGQNIHECWNFWKVPDGHVKKELLARGRGDLYCGVALIQGEI